MAEISYQLIKQFAELTAPANENKTDRTYGTVVKGNRVIFDGSELETPCETTVSVSAGDRVIVDIKDHIATIVGNVTDPAYNSTTSEKSLNKVQSQITNVQEQISTNSDDRVSMEQKITELETRCDSMNTSIREVTKALIVDKLDADGNTVYVTDEEESVIYMTYFDDNDQVIETPITVTSILTMEEVQSELKTHGGSSDSGGSIGIDGTFEVTENDFMFDPITKQYCYLYPELHMAMMDVQLPLKNSDDAETIPPNKKIPIGVIPSEAAPLISNAAISAYVNGIVCSASITSDGSISLTATSEVAYSSDDDRTVVRLTGCWAI